jgi:hypothetical protein
MEYTSKGGAKFIISYKKKQWRPPSKKKKRRKNLSPRSKKACHNDENVII